MKPINYHTSIQVLYDALDPGSSLIDGRTEQDWLSFLSNFASLINFYDYDNKVKGNWSPFLLKDPVILLASISRTNFEKQHSLYLNTRLNLQNAFIKKERTDEDAILMNQLFDQLTSIFMRIERWTHYMQVYEGSYDLKKYLIEQVKTKFSTSFWAILLLRQYLSSSSAIKGISPVQFYLFEAYDEIIWKESKNKNSFWEILGLEYPVTSYSGIDFFNALKKPADELFNFFHTVIHHSQNEFEKLKSKKCSYPDTVLLRTFVNLLKNYQDQLNSITQKHLSFYYKDILKQSEMPAIPDRVFICAELTKNNDVFKLPAGSLFDGGVDANKNPIVFETLTDEHLNPAAITTAYTLARAQGTENLSSLYLKQIADPGALKKNKDGKILPWETFGSSANTQLMPVKLAVAFASPLLLLREGKRKITVELNFEGNVDDQLLQKADYYLTTQKKWLEVPVQIQWEASRANSINLEISLDITDPAIESFTKDPDGLDSIWPMFKIQFHAFKNLEAPPILNSIIITAEVSNIQTFQLYNDQGGLSTKTPFPVFGSLPSKNSSFIFGNNEIFSKPLTSLFIEMNWDALPDDFSIYYNQYNRYLLTDGVTQAVNKTSAWKAIKKFFKRVPNVIVRFLKRLVSWLKSVFKPAVKTQSIKKEGKQVVVKNLFSNICFTADFKLLRARTWSQFDMVKQQKLSNIQENGVSFVPYQIDPSCNFEVTDINSHLFDTGTLCTLSKSSYFGFTTTTAQIPFADPHIQEEVLKLTPASESGFMKIVLSGPEYGFGAGLYPGVVSYIATNNAVVMYQKQEPKNLLQPARVPFIPKLASFVGYYTASQKYTFGAMTDKCTYPLQCYSYSPFTNSLVYDNSKDISVYQSNVFMSVFQPQQLISGLPLYSPVSHDGILFLEMKDIVASNVLNFYFELSGNYHINATVEEIGYYYLSSSGWKELPVVFDGTNDLSCSGIIKVSVPEDITNKWQAMPAGKFWLSVAVKGNLSSFPQTIFLKTNGIEVQRYAKNTLPVSTRPFLPGNSITRLRVPVPQIASISQPFASFGGKMAENSIAMNRRVSNRIKTKDRAINAEDYYCLLQQEFDDIYYSKTLFNPSKKITEVCIVKAYLNSYDVGAFLPLAPQFKLQQVKEFLRGRSSVFTNIDVSNFDIQFVKVTARVSVQEGCKCLVMSKKINEALNIFLSPWIKDDDLQVSIDRPINDVQVTTLIKSIKGVSTVENVLLQTWMEEDMNSQKKNVVPFSQSITQCSPKALLVSCMDHIIQCK